MIEVASLPQENLQTLRDLLDRMSWEYINKPMADERKAVYIAGLLREPDLEDPRQLFIAITKIIDTWDGSHFPWIANIRDAMPRREKVYMG